MQVTIPYSKDSIKIELLESHEILYPNKIEIKNEINTINEALRNPIDKKPFDNFISESNVQTFDPNKITLIVTTQKTPLRSHPYINENIIEVVDQGTELKSYKLLDNGYHRLMNGYYVDSKDTQEVK